MKESCTTYIHVYLAQTIRSIFLRNQPNLATSPFHVITEILFSSSHDYDIFWHWS